jgi:hypothetical protein
VLSTEGGYSAHASVVARQYGKVSLVKPDLSTEIGFTASVAYAQAYEWEANTTAMDGFRSRLRAGDFMAANNLRYPVESVSDGYLRFVSPIDVGTAPKVYQFYNAVRYDWESACASLVLPVFDVDAYERAADQVERLRDARLLAELSRGGLVVTARGPAGGARLARPPAEIPLLEVLPSRPRMAKPTTGLASTRRTGWTTAARRCVSPSA